MNKLKLALALSFFLLPSFVFATSGACSYHGGVDCSAGAGDYGQVICNDGWTGSSVSYDSMEECQTTAPAPSCMPPVATECTSVMDHCGAGQLGTMYQSCVTDCQNNEAAYQSQLQTYNACLGQSQQTPSVDTEQQSVQNAEQTDQQEETLIQQEESELQQMSANASCGANETFNQTTNECECDTGDTYLDSECMTPDEVQETQQMDATVAAQATEDAAPVTPPTPPSGTGVDSWGVSASATPPPTHAFKGDTVTLGNSTSSTTTIATSSTAPAQHKSTGILSQVYGFFASFFRLFSA